MPADLPRNVHEAVIDIWPMVRHHVYDAWMARTDPAAVEPRVPTVMREATNLVRRRGTSLGATQDTLVARLAQDTHVRTQRDVRRVLRDTEGDPTTAVQALAELADNHRLVVPRPVETLPEIEPDDIRVLAWTAIHPGSDGGSGSEDGSTAQPAG